MKPRSKRHSCFRSFLTLERMRTELEESEYAQILFYPLYSDI